MTRDTDNEDERFQKPWKVEPQMDRDLSDRLRYLEGELAASRSDVAPLEAKIIATEAERDQLREEVGRLRQTLKVLSEMAHGEGCLGDPEYGDGGECECGIGLALEALSPRPEKET